MWLKNTKEEFNSKGYWELPIDSLMFVPLAEDFAMFDQTGYDLTPIERRFAWSNNCRYVGEQAHRNAIRKDWLIPKSQITENANLNHSHLFERKGYAGLAKKQLEHWATDIPLCHKLLAIRPKWGLDFSADWCDRDGNCFEILHWEYDSFDLEEIQEFKEYAEVVFERLDWDDVAKRMLAKKDEWYNLDYFGQSHWKCQFVGMPDERFKVVTWK